MDLNLSGKRAFVTGASAGIGFEVAMILAREGAQLAVAATREDRLSPLVDAMAAEGLPAPATCAADLTAPDGPASLAEQAMAALGQIPDPLENKPVVRLELARHHIDTLGVLEEKTKGNLTDEEHEMLETVLHQLRMVFLNFEKQS